MENRTAIINIRVTPKVKREFQIFCKLNEKSESDILRERIRRILKSFRANGGKFEIED